MTKNGKLILEIVHGSSEQQFGMLRIAVGWVGENGLKDTASLRTSECGIMILDNS